MDEAVASIFHTVLFYRTLGKFDYNKDTVYSVGTIGTTDVDCDFIDFTYVCCTSQQLDRTLKGEINRFSEQLRSNESCGQGQISLEFYEKKKKSRWFAPECSPWEVWTVRLDLLNLSSEEERQQYREKVGDMLSDKIIYIGEVLNRHDYVPRITSQSEMDLIFDTSYPDIQPYLFKCKFSTAQQGVGSVGNAVKKIIKETLSL